MAPSREGVLSKEGDTELDCDTVWQTVTTLEPVTMGEEVEDEDMEE